MCIWFVIVILVEIGNFGIFIVEFKKENLVKENMLIVNFVIEWKFLYLIEFCVCLKIVGYIINCNYFVFLIICKVG